MLCVGGGDAKHSVLRFVEKNDIIRENVQSSGRVYITHNAKVWGEVFSPPSRQLWEGGGGLAEAFASVVSPRSVPHYP